MPPCSGCGVDRAKSDFTSSQLKLKAARRCKACVTGAPVTAQPRSIAGAFMTAAELPSSLVDASRLRLARVYMDHDFPVKMSDGSPKQIPAAALQCADASELMRTFGYGAGGFMGEVLFWKRHHGVLLGKQKWECHSDEGPEGDTAAMSELWEARWLFASSAEARRFHADMLSASRGERGCGYLDGPEPGLEDTRGACRERPDVFSGALCEAGGAVEGLVVSSNEPRPLPKRGGLRSPEVGRAPTQYLQQHSAAFVVDRVVAKLFVASGINARDAAGRHVGVTPAAFVQLVRVASEAISRWLAHGRTPGTAVSFDAFFEQLLRSGTISEAQFDRITDELANGCKTEAELVAEWAAATGSGPPGGPDGEQRPKARSHGSLAAEVMGEGVALRPGGKVRIVGLQGRRDLNGLFGEVVSLGDDPHSERLTIKVKGVSTGSGQINVVSGEYPYQCVRIKPANLVPVYDTPQHETQGLCPICMSVEMRTILDGAQNATMMTCCGKPICLKCLYEIETGPLRDVCPFCRADTSDTSDEATVRGLTRRAQQGDASAQYNLGCHYDYGRMGLPLDQVEARRLYQLAAEQGHARAAANLGCSHRDGEGGPVDLSQAAHWFKVATDLGHTQACTNLGIAYMRGDGVPQSRMEAIRYLTRAANAGDELAARQLMRMGVQP